MKNLKSMLWILLVLTFFHYSKPAQVMLTKSIALPVYSHSANITGHIYFFETAPFIMGQHQEADTTDGQTMNMTIDLSSPTILLPNADVESQSTYGFKCKAAESCTVSHGENICRYNDTQGLCIDAYAPLRFSSKEAIDTSSYSLKFQLMQDVHRWTIGKNGVLGLAPTSEFWTYITSAYRQSSQFNFIQLSFNYEIIDPATAFNLSALMLQNSQIDINNLLVMVGAIVKDQKSSIYWSIDGLQFYTNHTDPGSAYNTCVVNTANNYLYYVNFNSQLKGNLLYQLCGSYQSCSEKQSVVGDVENLYLILPREGNNGSTVKIVLDPNEFIKFDADSNAVFTIGDIADLPPELCPEDTQLAIGRLMFTKVNFIIRAYPDGTFQVGLYSPGQEFYIFVLMTCLVFGNLLIIVLSLLVLKTINRNSKTYIESQYKDIVNKYLEPFDLLKDIKVNSPRGKEQ